ncbi:MAG: hypothetical protein ABI647_10420 [Gemmatimonadota bacterium]
MAGNPAEAINAYITELEALESHLEKLLRAQVADFGSDYPDLVAHLYPIHIRTQQHIQVLQAVADSREVDRAGAAAVKRVGSVGVAGFDYVRGEKLSKELRDDYAALSVATIGYVVLMAAARSLGDDSVADMAELHLRDYAEATMTIQSIIPSAIVKSLQEEGLPARAEVVAMLDQDLEEIWRGEADSGDVT